MQPTIREQEAAMLDRLTALAQAREEAAAGLHDEAVRTVHEGVPKSRVARAAHITRQTLDRWLAEP